MLYSSFMPYFIAFISIVTLANVKGYPVDSGSVPTTVKDLRKELCPPGKTSSLYRYHNESRKCYRTGDRGPCGTNMIFITEENSSAFGTCECDFQNSDTPLVYHESSNRCYSLYSKGYCNPGEWLVFTQDLKPVCQINSCEDVILMSDDEEGERGEPTTIVKYKGKCVFLNTRHADCEPKQVITFLRESPLLECGPLKSKNNILPTSLINPPSIRRCRPGSVKNILGKCRAANGNPKE